MIEHERLEEKLDELIALVSSEVVPAAESKKLKLYVWEKYCPIYLDGVAFALAENLEDAKKMLSEQTDGIEHIGGLHCAGEVSEYEIAPICFECVGGG